jgi:transcription elongation GreA/GreB family factor|tara:strand:- start:66 stop:311 length:246 start_codon:yes stop_codon:yes gene_type:complete
MSVVGAALRGFGRALKNRKRGKTITSVKPAERLTQRRKNTEDLFKIRHKHNITPQKANIQEAVKKTSAINDKFDASRKKKK